MFMGADRINDLDTEKITFDPYDSIEWENEDITGIVKDGEDDALETIKPANKNMTIFFLIDTSSSMAGTKIGTVNGTMEELLPELIEAGGTDADISIAVLRYSSNVEWITGNGPVAAQDYGTWIRLSASGVTSMGEAFRELNSKLSRNAFMNKPSLSYAPVIFLMTDGEPNDDWQDGLNKLMHNSWFKYGLKIAVGIGSSPNMDVLRQFTGKAELAVQAHSSKELKKLIEFLAVTSTQIGSKSMSLTEEGRELTDEDVTGSKEKELVEAVKDIMGEVDASADDIDFESGW